MNTFQKYALLAFAIFVGLSVLILNVFQYHPVEGQQFVNIGTTYAHPTQPTFIINEYGVNKLRTYYNLNPFNKDQIFVVPRETTYLFYYTELIEGGSISLYVRDIDIDTDEDSFFRGYHTGLYNSAFITNDKRYRDDYDHCLQYDFEGGSLYDCR